jgi:hypothetical protein
MNGYSPEFDAALSSFVAMELAIANAKEDGLVYENDFMYVWRYNGRTITQGKPIKMPTNYTVWEDHNE